MKAVLICPDTTDLQGKILLIKEHASKTIRDRRI